MTTFAFPPAHGAAAADAIMRLRRRSPRGRCHECGSSEIHASCCLCYRPMCGDHDLAVDVSSARTTLRYLLPTFRPLPRRAGVKARHVCSQCAPMSLHHTGLAIGAAAAAVVGLALMVVNVAVGALVAAVAVVVTVQQTVVLLRRFRTMQSKLRRRLSIDLGINSVSLVDTISGEASLNDRQEYSVRDVTVSGELVVDAEWPDAAWSQVRDYCRRNNIADLSDLMFSAGALALRGQVGLLLKPTPGCHVAHRAMLALSGKVGDAPFLGSSDGSGHRDWQVQAPYDIPADEDKPITMPIWLTPTIVPGSDRRSLDLEFQWATDEVGDDGLKLTAIDRLSIDVPTVWGPVLRSTEYGLVSIDAATKPGLRTIEWRDIKDVPHDTRGRHRISLAFQEQIGMADEIRGQAVAADEICGQVVARFDQMLSGIERIDLHLSNGARRTGRTRKRLHTTVRLDFTLSLAGIRYEAIRTLPPAAVGPARQNTDGPVPAVRKRSFERVIPDSRTVAGVTAELSAGDYYVKRVVENPPTPDRTAAAINRYWDISGRKYEGLYPIDFHIVLSGQEIHDGGAVVSGRTDVAISVRGAFTSDETRQRIDEEWESLYDRVESTLESYVLDMQVDGPRAVHEVIDDLLRKGQINRSVAKRLHSAVDGWYD